MKSGLRAFIAIELTADITRELAALQKRLRGHGLDLRWVRPRNIHLTLKFLGEIDVADVETTVCAMRRAAERHAPFRLRAEGVGVFPAVRNARVLWAGIGGGDRERLLALQASLDQSLADDGFPRDRRRFSGHLTLGRAKGKLSASALTQALSHWQTFRTEPFRVSEITLYSSRLLPGGAVYRPLERVGLKQLPKIG